MDASPNSNTTFSTADTLHPKRVRVLRQVEVWCQVFGVTAAVIRHGLVRITQIVHVELGAVVLAAIAILTLSLLLRYRWSLIRITFLRQNRAAIGLGAVWLLGGLFLLLFGPPTWGHEEPAAPHLSAFLQWSELLIVLRGVVGVMAVTRRAAAGGANPALVLVGSFAVLVIVGTLLLLLPRSRSKTAPADEPFVDRLRIAVFTATSASCVTGLTVVDTGGSDPYWSRTGQTVILGLFQLGGLGIMTFGAFFAVIAGREMQIRESATFRELLESEAVGDVRRLALTILAFTVGSELVGAVLLSGLFSDHPIGERAFFSLFHAVSGFCNAGFSLTENSLVGRGTGWQVWGVMSGLIIVGGLGFTVIYNVTLVLYSRFRTIRHKPLFQLPQTRLRLSLSSKLVLVTTAVLLASGFAGHILLESTGRAADPQTAPLDQRLADAWFQSVTSRTAGFNTVEQSGLQPATKLMVILLMFIGASPGSTGGGIKTVCFALAILALVSSLRGRGNVEIQGRTIPAEQVHRALAIGSLGIMLIMAATMLIVIFEGQPDRFLDHLFEATSAFGTVGLSTIGTGSLTPPSQLVITVTMFVGRVGPLTALLALAGRSSDARYTYPYERVVLG